MPVENINVENAVQRVNDLIAQEKILSPALKASLEAATRYSWNWNQ